MTPQTINLQKAILDALAHGESRYTSAIRCAVRQSAPWVKTKAVREELHRMRHKRLVDLDARMCAVNELAWKLTEAGKAEAAR